MTFGTEKYAAVATRITDQQFKTHKRVVVFLLLIAATPNKIFTKTTARQFMPPRLTGAR